jgi:ABC-type dipeptide/oligopeptide/nickel transport system permease subunit
VGRVAEEAKNILTLCSILAVNAGSVVAASILAFNFLGDGLRDAADPYTV